MNNGIDELKKKWLNEESEAFQGWDFSHLEGRWESDLLPWDYDEIVQQHLKHFFTLLDMGTGGGEYLLTLKHPYHLTYATEAYPPNAELCQKTLAPLGIHVEQINSDEDLPFENGFFDIIINRHESFDPNEIHRCLKPNGFFITQQVGGENNKELSKFLLPEIQGNPFCAHNLENNIQMLKNAGLDLIYSDESFSALRFYDIGALVYFAKIIEWEFPGFSVEHCYAKLCELQNILEKKGSIVSREHRFIIIAQKSPI